MEENDWWKGEHWTLDKVKEYSNSRGYHGFTMDKNTDKVNFKKCNG